jgi:hypothetical protein
MIKYEELSDKRNRNQKNSIQFNLAEQGNIINKIIF